MISLPDFPMGSPGHRLALGLALHDRRLSALHGGHAEGMLARCVAPDARSLRGRSTPAG